jgi:hypothetical protein
MIVLMVGETLAVWSVASLSVMIASVVPFRSWRQHRRDRRAVRERLFRLCQ